MSTGRERGFRRIVIALSVLVLGLGIALDVTSITLHATVQVLLSDGRKFTVERQGTKGYLTDRELLAYALRRGEGTYKGSLKSPATTFTPTDKTGRPSGPAISYPSEWVSAEDAATIVTVEYVHGPKYWWWADSDFVKVATGLALFFWIVFYTIVWIARGSARPNTVDPHGPKER